MTYKTRKNLPKNNVPAHRFIFMAQEWRRIVWACVKNGWDRLASEIKKHIEGKRSTDMIEIAVPVDVCRKIARACASHGVEAGGKFMVAAAPYYVETTRRKPPSSEVMAEAVSNAQEELKEMEAME